MQYAIAVELAWQTADHDRVFRDADVERITPSTLVQETGLQQPANDDVGKDPVLEVEKRAAAAEHRMFAAVLHGKAAFGMFPADTPGQAVQQFGTRRWIIHGVCRPVSSSIIGAPQNRAYSGRAARNCP